MEQLGINMSETNLEAFALSQGISKSYSEMSEAEKATLRYNYIMNNTSEIQGDFAKSSKSLSNQLLLSRTSIEQLSIGLGSALIPMAQGVIEEFANMTVELNNAFSEDGLGGLASKFGSIFGNMLTGISEKVPEIMASAVVVIQSFIIGIQESLPQIIEAAISIIESLINGIFEMLPYILELGINLIACIATGITEALPNLLPALLGILLLLVDIFIINMPMIIQAGIDLVNGLIFGLIAAIPILLEQAPIIIQNFVDGLILSIPMLINAALAIIDGLIEFITNPDNLNILLLSMFKCIDSIVDGLIIAIPLLVDATVAIINKLVEFITTPGNLSKIIQCAVQLLMKLIEGLIISLPSLIDGALKIVDVLIDTLFNTDWFSVGADILSGIGKGLLNGVASIARKIGSSLLEGVKSFLGINSPSRVFRDDVGKYLAQGIGVGFTEESENIESDMQDSLLNLTSNMRATVEFETSKTSLGMMSGLTSSGSNEITVDNNDSGVFVIKNYMDSDEISEYTYRKVDNKFALAGKKVR